MSLPPGTRAQAPRRRPPQPSRGAPPPLGRIILALERAYGRPRAGARKDPLSELIFTVLSQNTSDTNRDRAWSALWERFGSWEEIAKAPRPAVERAIRSGGLARTKSAVIQEILRSVRAEQGSYSLDSLQGCSMEAVERALLRFRGVGLKTVRCVQVFSLGLPAFPVDTHIFRVTRRLGLIPGKATPAQAHAILQSIVPPREVLPFHINLITHGRRVCKAGRPLCEACVIRRWCPTGKAVR